MHRLAFPLITVVCLALTSCTKYEFVIKAPEESVGTLAKKEHLIEWEPVNYYFVDQSSRVGIRIENPGDVPLMIKGDESYVVTPDGESSPMRGGVIAPNTWIGITIPPLVRVYGGGGGGVSFGIGVGTWGNSGGGAFGVGYDPMWDSGFYAPQDEVAWRWKDGSVRMHLVIVNQEDPSVRSEQEFTIERRKVAK